MFTNLSTGVTASVPPGGNTKKTIMVIGDFGGSGQVQIQLEDANGTFHAFGDLTFDANAIKEIRLPARRWRVEAIGCTSVDVEVY